MPSAPDLLTAAPADPSSDFGPKHRGGGPARFLALASLLTGAGAAVLLFRGGEPVYGALALGVFGLVAVWSGRRVVQRLRYREKLPRTHAVLPGVLGFHLRCTCRDVGPAVFLFPDSASAGSATRLLCFVENYSTRRRIAFFRIGPHPLLGLRQPHEVALELAAGQAAVYVLPLALSAQFPPGEHDLPVTLRVLCPNGAGLRLPGAGPHFYDLHTVHYAAPLTVTAAPDAPAAAGAAGGEQYLSLASISEPAPRLDALQKLISGSSAGKPAA